MDDQGTKAVCFSCMFRESPEYVKAVLNGISIITIITLIWIIFTFIFRVPKFDTDMNIVMSVIRILSILIQFITLVYTCVTLSKYKKSNDPQEGYVITYAKVEIALLSIQFFLLVCVFIHAFMAIVNFIESYQVNNDTAFFAFSKVFTMLCLLWTTWELYMLVMMLYHPVDPNRNSHFRVADQRVVAPVYIPKDEPEDGDEDDLPVMNTKGGGYIGESSRDEEQGPVQIYQPKAEAGDAEEDDFLVPNVGDNGYLDDSDSTEKLAAQPQYYKPGDADTKPLKGEDGEGPL